VELLQFAQRQLFGVESLHVCSAHHLEGGHQGTLYPTSRPTRNFFTYGQGIVLPSPSRFFPFFLWHSAECRRWCGWPSTG
jgi:hypothetical protein